jgi:hypothetical protein
MRSAAVTLFEGHYHLGAAALINSLHAAGFSGVFICGHRGPLPPWADAARALAPQIEVRWVALETKMHLTNHKPAFLRECWSGAVADADQLYYFDPDIVVKAPWSVLERWAQDGIALCEDLNANFPSRHPYRLAWLDFFQRHGLTPRRTLERYYNAGFFALPRGQKAFLELWIDLVARAAVETGSLDKLKNAGPHALFHSADQDALNMALLLTTAPINSAGPEAMDFIHGGHLLSHAAGGVKPWRGGFVRSALCGRPPGLAQKFFYDYAAGPLPVFSAGKLARLRWSLKLAGLIGRFYRRA